MKKIFVSGSTGVLGKRLIPELVESGYEVIALSRNRENTTKIEDMGAIAFVGDLFDEKSMVEGCKGCDAIFHLATSIPKKEMPDKPKDWALNDKIRIEGTQNLLNAAITNGVKYFIQPSVSFIYRDQKGKSVFPDMEIPKDQLFMLKSAVQMEEKVRNSGIDFVILRFGKFYSDDSIDTRTLIESIKKRKMPMIGKGDFYWNFIHVDDASSALIYTFENADKLKNKTLNFSDFHPVKYGDFITYIAGLTEAKNPRKIPLFLLKLFLKRDILSFLTDSYKIVRTQETEDWEPKYKNVYSGFEEIINRLNDKTSYSNS